MGIYDTTATHQDLIQFDFHSLQKIAYLLNFDIILLQLSISDRPAYLFQFYENYFYAGGNFLSTEYHNFL